ncbi:Hsp20/alpha crystallin family protein [Candidatus Woesearchaeota archaeon]|nr:Hsp20/alpha crystallin family protein [Candidatus Woesearchaeota archaeon]
MLWDDPFEELKKMQEKIRRMFDLYNEEFGGLINNREVKELKEFRSPKVDIKERGNNLLVSIDVPGVEKKDIDLKITDRYIEIKAEKEEKIETEDKEKGQYSYKASSRKFYRKIPLPEEVNEEEATATYKNGVLNVIAPKKKKESEKKERKIKIE